MKKNTFDIDRNGLPYGLNEHIKKQQRKKHVEEKPTNIPGQETPPDSLLKKVKEKITGRR